MGSSSAPLIISEVQANEPPPQHNESETSKRRMPKPWTTTCLSIKHQLSLRHRRPLTFVMSQWQTTQHATIWYACYRWLVALFFISTLLISLADLRHPDASARYRLKWFIYLTNWGYTMCTLQALLGSLMVTIVLLSEQLDQLQKFRCAILNCYPYYWGLHTVAVVIAFCITTLYWTVIYDNKIMPLDAPNILVHANNSIMMMMDLFVVAFPIRLCHFCYSIAFGICYIIFSIIYYLMGGYSKEGYRFIYTILNWDNPGRTLFICIAVLSFLVIMHVITWFLYKLRLWMFYKCVKTDGQKGSSCVQGFGCTQTIEDESSTKKCYENQIV